METDTRNLESPLASPNEIAEALTRSFAAFRQKLDALDPQRRESSGPAGAWSPKVQLAHVAFWDDYQTGRMVAALAGRSRDGYPRPDHDNEDRAQADQMREWEEVAAAAQAARARMIEFVLGLDDHVLAQEFWEGDRAFSFGAQLRHMVRHTEMHAQAILDEDGG